MSGSLAPAAPGRDSAGAELRVTERFPCEVEAACQPPADWKRGGKKWSARVRDVSSGGLCLVLGRRFERGAGLAIELPTSDPDSPSILLARVVNVRAEGGGAWALGCSFISPLSDEEIAALTRSADADAAEEKAAAAARPYVADVFFRGVLPDGGVVERLIRKLHRGEPWPLPAGRTLGLRFHDASGQGTIAKVRVNACRSAAGRWVLECTFVGAAPANLLKPGC